MLTVNGIIIHLSRKNPNLIVSFMRHHNDRQNFEQNEFVYCYFRLPPGTIAKKAGFSRSATTSMDTAKITPVNF